MTYRHWLMAAGCLVAAGVGALATLAVQTWRAPEPQTQTPQSTAIARVQEQRLFMDSLQRERLVRIYTPPSYKTSPEQHYPVVYFHDGQNVFDQASSYAGEWNLDEVLDALAASHGLELIAVAIDHGNERRIQELLPWPHPDFPTAEGDAYVTFIVQQLKPWVDAHYRTRPEAQQTGIMGSSLGGLMSHYAAATRPDVFGRAGIFSPSYWVSPDSATLALPNGVSQRLLFLMGEHEGGSMLEDFIAMQERIGTQAPEDTTRFITVAHGEHNETLWRTHLGWALLWLYPDYRD